jgi:hypothetical protein
MEGQGVNGLVVGSSQTRTVQRKTPGSRAWTSFIECISATGVALPPAVIFKGGSVQQQWFPVDKGGMEDWIFTATEKGWTNQSVAVEWLTRVFIPRTQPSNPSHRRLLVLDGHDSHTSTEFMYECFKNNIQLLFLPAHTSHVLQPLDLAVFSPLKQSYRTHLNTLNSWVESSVVGKQLMLKCLIKARREAFTAQNITSGWKAGGLWPVSLAKPLSSRLLINNSNPAPTTDGSTTPPQTPTSGQRGRSTVRSNVVSFTTPRKKTVLRGHLSTLATTTRACSTQRLLFRKLEKAFDEKDFELARLRQENEALRAKLEATTKTKKKKVFPDPNKVFATIEQVHKAQMEVGRVTEPMVEESGSWSPRSDASCIVVG